MFIFSWSRCLKCNKTLGHLQQVYHDFNKSIITLTSLPLHVFLSLTWPLCFNTISCKFSRTTSLRCSDVERACCDLVSSGGQKHQCECKICYIYMAVREKWRKQNISGKKSPKHKLCKLEPEQIIWSLYLIWDNLFWLEGMHVTLQWASVAAVQSSI